MTKFTLGAFPGDCFKTQSHFLVIGEWFNYRSDLIIFQHGFLTDEEVSQIRNNGYVNLYQNSNLKTITIFEPCSKEYSHRLCNKEDLQSYIGKLYKESDNVYIGEVVLR